MKKYLDCRMPPNYYLTYSRTENNGDVCKEILRAKANVAIVFHPSIPEKWERFTVINGDESDLRFLDPEGVWVGLTAKARAKKDMTGFTIRR